MDTGHERDDHAGFTLIELLVVMIIIGILAAIAIPVFLNQRKKAVDTAGKSDVSTIGKEVAAYYVDGTGLASTLVLASGTRYSVNGVDAGRQSSGVTLRSFTATSTSAWCVDVNITGGTLSTVKFSAKNGYDKGACASTDQG